MEVTFNDLDTGWSWVAMAACFGCLLVIGGANYCVGVIHTVLLERFHQNQATTAWVGALYTSIMNLGGPLSSYVMDRFSARTAIVLSGTFFTAGYVATAYVPSVKVAIFTCGIVAGLGGAIGWTASLCFIGFYFQKYRSLAQGFAVAGTGVGIFVIPPIMQLGKEAYGFSGPFIVLACFSVHLILFGCVLRPSKLEQHVHIQRHKVHKGADDEETSFSLLRTYLQVFTTRTVMLLSASMFMKCVGLYIIFLYLPNYCLQNGSTDMQASFVISVTGILSIFGRILTGMAANSDRINDIFVHSGSIGTMAATTSLFPLFAHTYVGQIAYAVLLGLVFGSPYVILTPINVSYLGVANMGAALGIQLCFCGLGALAGPPLAGYILDKGGTYEHTFFAAAAVLALGALLGAAVYLWRPRSQPVSTQEYHLDRDPDKPATVMLES